MSVPEVRMKLAPNAVGTPASTRIGRVASAGLSAVRGLPQYFGSSNARMVALVLVSGRTKSTVAVLAPAGGSA